MQSLVENTSIPAFLGKLWKMVDDPATDHLISWSQAGNSFIIQNQAQFWYELLPLYYKHNNMSSFVRQLNMYGFHKITTVENGSMDADKDEIQFYHPYFQKDHPEKLINIKRKVTTSKGQDNQGVIRHDDLTKVLTDVKQLRGRQSSVDAQLSAMKQENAVLWRELALLRQKHIKQQQIVNKLIQFLVTLVQPTSSPRMGVGVKRRMPLMLHESSKKVKSRKNSRPSTEAGPTIFELENEVHLSPNDLISQSLEEDEPLVNSPSDRTSKNTSPPNIDQDFQNENELEEAENIDLLWDKPEFVDIDEQPDDITNQEQNLIESLAGSSKLITEPAEKVFINPSNRNTLISNLVSSGSYNINALAGKNIGSGKKIAGKKSINNTQISAQSQPRMQIATKNNQATDTTNSGTGLKENLDKHLDTAQIELDQLKDILSNCNTFDANALLGLFNDNDPDYGIRSTLTNRGNPGEEAGDPMVSGSELTPANNLIDFTELFDDSSLTNDENNLGTESDLLGSSEVLPLQNVSLDTPLILKNEPLFPSST